MSNGTPTPLPQAAPTGAPAPGAGESQQLKDILTRLRQRTAQPKMAGPQPAPPQAQKSLEQPGITPHMLTRGVLGMVHDLAAQHKKTQLDHATQRIQGLADAITRAYEQSTDPMTGKIDEAQADFRYKQSAAYQSMLSKEGQKDLQQMKKLAQYDFLNPEKGKTVWHEALEKVAKLSGAEATIKGIRSLIGGHKEKMAQAAKKQQEEQEKQGQARTFADTMFKEATPVPIDPLKAATVEADVMKAQADLERAHAALRDKYQPVVDKDGNVKAFDKSTGEAKDIFIGDKPLTAMPKPGQKPQVAKINEVPYGIARDGKIIVPKNPDGTPNPEWTGEDQKTFSAAMGASSAVQARREKLAQMRTSFFASLPQGVVLKQDNPVKGLKAGELAFVSRQEAAAHPDLYAPPSQGTAAMGATARFGEIQQTVDIVRQALDKMPEEGFDTVARAQIAGVLRDPDPSSALSTFMNSTIADTLNDDQMRYVTSLVSLTESAMALGSLQGIGRAGSDKLRAAITKMLPGPGTPSKKYGTRQLVLFQTELNALRKGVPGMGPLGEGIAAPGPMPPGVSRAPVTPKQKDFGFKPIGPS